MAKVTKKTWTSRGPTGKRVKHVSWGYTLMVEGHREKRFSRDWTTETDALTALLARQQALAAGVVTQHDRTLKALSAEYLQYKRDQGKRTVDGDKRILEGRLLPAFGPDLTVRRLTTHEVAQYERRRAGQVSAYTLANELAVLRHMLRLAKRWGYVDTVPEIVLPKKPEGRQRYLDLAEIPKLLAACQRSKNRYLAPIVTLALNTGMRKGEILGLEWPRIDLSSARITLYRTKNGKPRGVPINRPVYDALVALQPDPAQRAGLLFAKRSGEAWGQVRTAFQTALTRAGIPGFRFHDLRHTAASWLVMRGASLKDVQEILGHADLKMVQRYAHLSPAHLRGAVERLEGLTDTVLAHDRAQSDTLEPDRLVNPRAPVAQSDRARVS